MEFTCAQPIGALESDGAAFQLITPTMSPSELPPSTAPETFGADRTLSFVAVILAEPTTGAAGVGVGVGPGIGIGIGNAGAAPPTHVPFESVQAAGAVVPSALVNACCVPGPYAYIAPVLYVDHVAGRGIASGVISRMSVELS